VRVTGETQEFEVTVQEEPSPVRDNVFRESFEAFYARERQPIVGLAFVLSGSRTGAEDLAQEAFVAALRNWNRIGSYDDPGAWVRRVVSNNSVSVFRRRAAEARALIRLGSPGSPVPEPEEDTMATWDAVRRLPTRQAQVVALHYFDGQQISDIARILECSENTVKTHLKRAMTRLRQEMET
jgi:RNA polymerase sigma-70 factor (ECF subfamily)